MGVRVWTDRRIVPWTPVEAMDRFQVLSVTLLPGTVVWIAGFLICVVSRVGAHFHGSIAGLVEGVIVTLLGLVALAAFGVAVSLFFFTRPRRFVPPRYRKG
jgi:hypothetical protein